jgi:phosphate-selective porin OprO and OprP
MKGKSALMAGVAAVTLLATAQAGLAAKGTSDGTSAPAAVSGPSNAELAARVQALEEALQTAQDKTQADHSRLSALEQNFNYTTWTFDNARPVISSGDGRFTMALRVRFQGDFADYMQRSPANAVAAGVQYPDLANGMVVRRAFFGVEGKAFSDFWYELRYDGGGTASESTSLSIARIAYTGIPHFRVNVGVIEPALMLEGTTSSGQLMFMERPEIDNIAADNFGAGDKRRGIEVAYQYENLMLPGDNFVLTAAYTGDKIGVSHASATTATGTNDEVTNFLGRLSYRMWSDGISNAVFGFSTAYANTPNGYTNGSAVSYGDRPEIRVDNDKLISASVSQKNASMYGFDLSGNFENLYLGAEWAHFMPNRTGGIQSPEFDGWFVEGSWFLTGETKTYNANATNNEIGGWGAPKVASPFSWEGDSWGALEFVARYSDTNLDWNRGLTAAKGGVAGGREKIGTIGFNWYLNNVVRFGVYDEIVNVNKVSAAGSTTQVGQTFNVIGARLQFSN